jgi:hypothetical protein
VRTGVRRILSALARTRLKQLASARRASVAIKQYYRFIHPRQLLRRVHAVFVAAEFAPMHLAGVALNRSIVGLVALGVLLAASIGRAAEVATPDDTARFIAGLAPATDSPLAPLTKSAAWQQHARAMDIAFQALDKRQLSKIRAWSRANLKSPKPVLFYMFSGPDFLYANAFFPSASTYVLSGLELAGEIPDLTKLAPAATTRALNGLRHSLRSILSTSFFITSYMGRDLGSSRLTGTLPILVTFLARTGHTIKEVTRVTLDEHGEAITSATNGGVKWDRGVKIVFSAADGAPRTLYYLRTDLSNKKFQGGLFSQFCEKLNEGDGFVKSASYALHAGNFSQVRKFLLDHVATMVQDDTGIPVGLYDTSKWQLRPFGNYVRPIPVFARMFQPKMQALFMTDHPNSIEFGIGYRSRPGRSGLLVATRRDEASRQ